MKRFLKIVAVCMLVAMVAMMFASCGIFSPSVSKAKSNLKDKDYIVLSISNEQDIYSVLAYECWGIGFDLTEMPDTLVLGEAEDDDELFIGLYYDTTSDAKTQYKKLEKVFKNDFDDGLWLDDTTKLDPFTYGRIGKLVYFGTVQAAKDALGFPMNLFIKEK